MLHASPVGCTLLWFFKASPPPPPTALAVHVIFMFLFWCPGKYEKYVAPEERSTSAHAQKTSHSFKPGFDVSKTASWKRLLMAAERALVQTYLLNKATWRGEEEAACKVNVFSIPLMPPDIFLHLSPLLVPCEAAGYNRASHAFRLPQRKAALWKEAAD